MQIQVKIFRYDPQQDTRPRYDEFTLHVDPRDRVLDVLEKIKGEMDSSLAFRRSCGHGMCGSDAMRINGVNRLACKTLVQSLGTSRLVIEPLLGFPVVKDLMVDMDPFFEQYRKVKPWLIRRDPPPEHEFLQTPEEHARYNETSKCILCAACTTSCPTYWADSGYLGPAALVAAHRFIFDSRDQGGHERLQIIADENGVWRCRTVFNCTLACPRDIPITKAIAQLKRIVLSGKVPGASP